MAWRFAGADIRIYKNLSHFEKINVLMHFLLKEGLPLHTSLVEVVPFEHGMPRALKIHDRFPQTEDRHGNQASIGPALANFAIRVRTPFLVQPRLVFLNCTDNKGRAQPNLNMLTAPTPPNTQDQYAKSARDHKSEILAFGAASELLVLDIPVEDKISALALCCKILGFSPEADPITSQTFEQVNNSVNTSDRKYGTLVTVYPKNDVVMDDTNPIPRIYGGSGTNTVCMTLARIFAVMCGRNWNRVISIWNELAALPPCQVEGAHETFEGRGTLECYDCAPKFKWKWNDVSGVIEIEFHSK